MRIAYLIALYDTQDTADLSLICSGPRFKLMVPPVALHYKVFLDYAGHNPNHCSSIEMGLQPLLPV
jgi:hypothetical protein